MKKTIVSVLLVVAVIAAAFLITGCEPKEEAATVTEITAEVVAKTVYKVGSAFDTATITITAHYSDETTTKVPATNPSVVYHKETLKLVNNKFTEKGTFSLKITALTYEATVEITVTD